MPKQKCVKTALSLFLSLLCFLLCASPALAASEDVGTRIEDYVREHEDTLAGMAVSVFDADSVEYENYFGYADVEAGVPVTEDTVFDWGSITKLTVWLSVMQLWEQGKLDLEADVRSYLPEGFLKRLAYDEPLTMIHLMNHQGGFEDSPIGLWVPEERDIVTLEDYLYRFQPAQVYAPGTVTSYNNWSTSLAGYIVERISGEPFYQYVQEHLFRPIGIEHAALSSDLSDNLPTKERRMALQCYDASGNPLKGSSYLPPYPCGGCVSPLRDLRRFAQELLNPDTVWFGSRETYETLFAPTAWYGNTDLPLNSHGFWHFRCYAVPLIGHGGNTRFCSSKLMLDPESGRGMVVLVNQQSESVFTHIMAEAVFGNGKYDIPAYRGWLESARTAYGGIMKVYQIVSIVPPSKVVQLVYGSDFCVPGSAGGVEKICSCYADYLIKTPGEILSMYLMLGWGALGILYAVFALLWKLIALFARRRERCPADGFAVSTSLLSLSAGGMLLAFALSLLSLAFWSPADYRLWSIGMLLILLALTALCVRGLVSFRKIESKGRRVMRIAALIAAVGVVANIVYWNLFMFWTV